MNKRGPVEDDNQTTILCDLPLAGQQEEETKAGAGELKKVGAGTLTLSGVSSY